MDILSNNTSLGTIPSPETGPTTPTPLETLIINQGNLSATKSHFADASWSGVSLMKSDLDRLEKHLLIGPLSMIMLISLTLPHNELSKSASLE